MSSVATWTLGVRSDRVGASRVQLLERVGRVAGEHHMPAGVINADHRDVTGGVPGRRDGDDPSVIAERPAVREHAEWAAVERERLGSEPLREWLAQYAAHDSRHRRAEEPQLRIVDQDPPADMDQPVHVVAVGVSEHHFRDVVELEARPGHRGREFLLGGHMHPRERHVPRRGSLAGVDESQNPVVLDRPAMDWQRL